MKKFEVPFPKVFLKTFGNGNLRQGGAGTLPLVKFCDEKLFFVGAIPEKHGGELLDSKKLDYATKVNIIKPIAIASYNKNIGGVNLELGHCIIFHSPKGW